MPLLTHQGISFMLVLPHEQKPAEACHNHDSIERKTLYLLLYHTLIFALYPDEYTITQLVYIDTKNLFAIAKSYNLVKN
jgi:hypothetical protein